MSQRPRLDELATLEPPEDAHPDASVKLSVSDLRALLELIPAARELEQVFGSYMVPEQEVQHGHG